MKSLKKIMSEIHIFVPSQNEEYTVFPEGREISYQGTKEAILTRMKKKYPTLIKRMNYLMQDNKLFFYDGLTKNMIFFKENVEKEERNKAIMSYYMNLVDNRPVSEYIVLNQ